MRNHFSVKTLPAIFFVSAALSTQAKAWTFEDAVSSTVAPIGKICELFATPEGIGLAQCGMSSTMTSTALTSAFLKEMQQVQSDAFAFVAGEAATPALISIVDKIQSEIAPEKSFDEIVSLIASL